MRGGGRSGTTGPKHRTRRHGGCRAEAGGGGGGGGHADAIGGRGHECGWGKAGAAARVDGDFWASTEELLCPWSRGLPRALSLFPNAVR